MPRARKGRPPRTTRRVWVGMVADVPLHPTGRYAPQDQAREVAETLATSMGWRNSIIDVGTTYDPDSIEESGVA